MDSLRGLGQTLPSDTTEKQLQEAFRSAALSITGLFKAGKKAQSQAFRAGKGEALQDVLEFVQASLDHPVAPSQQQGLVAGAGSLARLIDYICARQETLTAEEEAEGDEGDDSGPSNPPRQSATTTQQTRPSIFRPHTTQPIQSTHTAHNTRAQPRAPPAHAPSSTPAQPAPPSPFAPRASTSSAPPPAEPSSPFRAHAGVSSPSGGIFARNAAAYREASPSRVGRQDHSALASSGLSAQHSSAATAPAAGSFPASTTSSNVATPATRATTRRRADKPAARAAAAATAPSAASSTSTSPASDSAASGGVVGSLKRRWANQPATADVELVGQEGGEEDGEGGKSEQDEGEGMEMDGMEAWDGRGERPGKRLSMRGVAGGRESLGL